MSNADPRNTHDFMTQAMPGLTVPTTVTSLRDLVAREVGQRWSEFAAGHPNLAEVIDATIFVENTVRQIAGDPEVIAAMEEAHLDRAQLDAAARILELIKRLAVKALL